MAIIRHASWALFFLGSAFLSSSVNALSLGPMPISLKNLPVPAVPGLLDGSDPVVVNKAAAIALGKALFWDVNVGSDGMACGSCHFHAGADGRIKNQVSPGGQSSAADTKEFSTSLNGGLLGPNHTLSLDDFPLYQRENPLMGSSALIHETDNVVGSSGTFSGAFKAVNRVGTGNDSCARSVDSVFHVGSVGSRRVTPRNAPSVINAVFNHRNFWDGRANNVFNGSSPWGNRDASAGVWVKTGAKTVGKQRLQLVNSSLASLAVAPPLNVTEMSCANRTMMDVGRKLLLRQPLQNQKVHDEDSVLGAYSLSQKGDLKNGLATTYKSLIMQAFNSKYWSYSGIMPTSAAGQAGYNQAEVNFPMFFGLAIQLYESTLISDESPFDKSARDANNIPINLTANELNGLEQFRKNQCGLCHLGPNFTAAAVNANASIAQSHPEAFGEPTFRISATTNVVNRIPLMFNGVPVTAFYDTGFASTGVVDELADIGVGGTDDFGNPLSFTQQYLQYLTGNSAAVLDGEVANVRSCDFQEGLALNMKLSYSLSSLFTKNDGIMAQPQGTTNCFLSPSIYAFVPTKVVALAELNKVDNKKMVAAVSATFKTPSLRNVELTGPYMHNGGMATLEQVVEFYARGGNVANNSKHVTRVFPQANLQTSDKNRADLVAFLKTLTDDRVRYEKAPFDHPEINVPHGHSGNEGYAVSGNPLNSGLAKDEYLLVPAVGANGSLTPLKPFQEALQP